MNFTIDCQDMKVGAEQLTMHEDFADEFVCKICLVHVVGCGPKLTKCSHLFCGDCLQQWFARHPNNQTWAQRAKSGGSVPCPVCKTALHKETDIFPVEKHGDDNSAMLWRMIQGLHIKCDGRQCADGCCSWTGELGSFRRHLESGTCGTEQSASETALSEEAPTESAALREFTKEPPSSPSTCSMCSPANSLAEEWSVDSVSEVAEDECGCKDAVFTGSVGPITAVESSAPELTSLIREIIDISESLDTSTFQTASDTSYVQGDCSEVVEALQDQASIEEIVGVSQLAPNTPTVEPLPDQLEPPMHIAQAAKTNKPKKSKSKAKKGNHSENAGQAKDAQERVQAAYQWQVFQWQAAQYQMAYAQRYQMAMHAARMQQAARYQPQHVGCVN
jgi:hypothetical protein